MAPEQPHQSGSTHPDTRDSRSVRRGGARVAGGARAAAPQPHGEAEHGTDDHGQRRRPDPTDGVEVGEEEVGARHGDPHTGRELQVDRAQLAEQAGHDAQDDGHEDDPDDAGQVLASRRDAGTPLEEPDRGETDDGAGGNDREPIGPQSGAQDETERDGGEGEDQAATAIALLPPRGDAAQLVTPGGSLA